MNANKVPGNVVELSREEKDILLKALFHAWEAAGEDLEERRKIADLANKLNVYNGKENGVKYMTQIHGEQETEEISKDRAWELLEGCYIDDAVADILDNGKSFRLRTPYRDIWTVTDDGLAPVAGFYGVCD